MSRTVISEFNLCASFDGGFRIFDKCVRCVWHWLGADSRGSWPLSTWLFCPESCSCWRIPSWACGSEAAVSGVNAGPSLFIFCSGSFSRNCLSRVCIRDSKVATYLHRTISAVTQMQSVQKTYACSLRTTSGGASNKHSWRNQYCHYLKISNSRITGVWLGACDTFAVHMLVLKPPQMIYMQRILPVGTFAVVIAFDLPPFATSALMQC